MRSKVFLFVWFLTFLYACTPSPSVVRNSSDDVCIPPLYDVAYPLGMGQETEVAPPREIAPQGNWKIQGDLPFPQDRFGSIHIRREQNELLLGTNSVKTLSKEIFIYSLSTKQWRSYSTLSDAVGVLFVATDGTIWNPVSLFSRSRNHPLLSRFNDKTGQFEFVNDIAGFLQAPEVRLISDIIEDQAGVLWFFVATDRNDILTSFNVKTQQSQKHYVGGLGVHGRFAVGRDGSVWFTEAFKDEVVQYIPSTQERLSYSYTNPDETGTLPAEFDRANYLFIDHAERLWFANYAWLEFSNDHSPRWHRVVESPVFITDRGWPGSQYIMAYQTSTYQSSNDWYWFTGGGGIVRLDLQKGSWCLMTTGSSEVVEDAANNLWIAVFGHLYMYPLKQ